MINHDFTSGAGIAHEISGTGTFTGVAEIGRASASVGAGNGGLKAVAQQLGAHMNGVVWMVKAAKAVSFVELDPTKIIRYTPLTGDTSEDAKSAFPGFLKRARASRGAASSLTFFDVAVEQLGDGSDPPAVGSATMAGGAEPRHVNGMSHYEGEDVNGGLIVFDAQTPLALVSFEIMLDASVAWELRLAALGADRTVGDYVPIANATSQRALVTTQVMIPPGSGLSFVANTQGMVRALVKRVVP